MSNTSSKQLMSVEETLDWLAATRDETPWTGAVTDGSDVLARIVLLERQISMLAGEQVLVMAEWVAGSLDRAHAERPAWVDPHSWEQAQELDYAERSAYAEVALELGLSDRTSDRRVHHAVELTRRLPATVEALCAGRVTLAKARVILAETENLDAELLAALEAELLGKAEGLTYGNLRRVTRRAVARADADAVAKRRAAAQVKRSVKMWEIADGMSALEAILPTPVAETVWAVLDATAHQAITPGDQRSIDAARADALVDLICFPPDTAPRISYQIQVISPDPDLNADPTRRLPTAAQARYVKARDLTLPRRDLQNHARTEQGNVHPGCRATRTEHDHTIAHAEHGPTLTKNLALRCPKHHRLKHLPGWSATQDPDGTLTLTTPSGRTYRTGPPDEDGIDPPTERIPGPPVPELELRPPF